MKKTKSKQQNLESSSNFPCFIQTARKSNTNIFDEYGVNQANQYELYDTLRDNVPIIDAAIQKIIRLVGEYKITCNNPYAEELLNDFCKNVSVSGVSRGLESFICNYLDSLLLYGNAIGEIVLNKNHNQVVGLFNANIKDIEIKKGSNPLDADIFLKTESNYKEIKNKEFIIFTALNNKAGEVTGNSILKGLPFVTGILLKIYQSIGQNFDRIGNIRYAISYKPSNDGIDKAYAKERAMQIAKEWSDGMIATKNGNVTDFISVGDVSIKVIGADNQMIDTNIPVRQMLEQIVSKLGIPPFLLGLSWTTTERMSKQQTDILTSELEYYRRLLEPIILKICKVFLRVNGYSCEPLLTWGIVNLQDESELAKARLYNAQADKLIKEMEAK